MGAIGGFLDSGGPALAGSMILNVFACLLMILAVFNYEHNMKTTANVFNIF